MTDVNEYMATPGLGGEDDAIEQAETVEYIDITPTWEALVDSLLLVYTSSESGKDRAYARSELHRMGRIADRYVAEHKEVKEECDHAVEGPCPHYS